LTANQIAGEIGKTSATVTQWLITKGYPSMKVEKNGARWLANVDLAAEQKSAPAEGKAPKITKGKK